MFYLFRTLLPTAGQILGILNKNSAMCVGNGSKIAPPCAVKVSLIEILFFGGWGGGVPSEILQCFWGGYPLIVQCLLVLFWFIFLWGGTLCNPAMFVGFIWIYFLGGGERTR